MATTTSQQPTWDMVDLFPLQGDWTEDDYLELEATIGNRMIELVDGRLEILPMPTPRHQRIVKFLLRRVDDFVVPDKLGEVMMAPMPVRVLPGRIREPDLMFFEAKRVIDADERPLQGPDLAMEVPSPGKKNRKRDLVIKRREYAKAKIREYWIVDPQDRAVTVLFLTGKSYKVHGAFKPGEIATSKLLKGFKIAVDDVFAAGDGK